MWVFVLKDGTFCIISPKDQCNVNKVSIKCLYYLRALIFVLFCEFRPLLKVKTLKDIEYTIRQWKFVHVIWTTFTTPTLRTHFPEQNSKQLVTQCKPWIPSFITKNKQKKEIPKTANYRYMLETLVRVQQTDSKRIDHHQQDKNKLRKLSKCKLLVIGRATSICVV